MKTFPMFLKMEGRRVVIAGGGEQAAQKARLIGKTEARLTLAAPGLDAELMGLVAAGRAEHLPAMPDAGAFEDAALVFVATGCPGADAALADLARAARVPVNVVDRPDLCDAFTPSIVDRDPVVVAIGTEGTAPVLGRRIKTEIETLLAPRLGGFAALAGRLRGAVAQSVPKTRRRDFWRWAFDAPLARHNAGAERDAARALKAAIDAGRAPDAETSGTIAMVGAGPGAADLLTLRAVRALQEADVIFHDRLIGDGVLELARRDAERVCVGKTPGTRDWPQDRISALIVSAARQGQRVVRLKGGDPMLFGRAEEEISAARAAGIPVSVIPGVTAASAASAGLARSLTERGATERVVFATATDRTGGLAATAGLARPGTTMAFYMGLRQAAALTAALRAEGVPDGAEVTIVEAASQPAERHVETTLAGMAGALAEHAVTGPAIILLRWSRARDAASEPKAPYTAVA